MVLQRGSRIQCPTFQMSRLHGTLKQLVLYRAPETEEETSLLAASRHGPPSDKLSFLELSRHSKRALLIAANDDT